jgi:hypothetical protein
MNPSEPFPYLGAASPERMRDRAVFAERTAKAIGTPFAELQAWLAMRAALLCQAPADLVLP